MPAINKDCRAAFLMTRPEKRDEILFATRMSQEKRAHYTPASFDAQAQYIPGIEQESSRPYVSEDYFRNWRLKLRAPVYSSDGER